jgi:hypothetical protein
VQILAFYIQLRRVITMRNKNKKTDLERRTLLEAKEAYNVRETGGRDKQNTTDEI